MGIMYIVRFVHRVRPSDKDRRTVLLDDGDFSDSRKLADALRCKGILQTGARLREMRVEGDRVVCFPDRGIWHSVTLELED